MLPDLVCKIVIRTPSGEWYRGSGYPITPDRIITAAHVVADAGYKEDATRKGAARDITLTFGVEEQTLDAPVYLEWCGTDAGVDVAVLRCQLPAALQPAHQLLIAPPKTPIKWEAQGYTEFGKAKRQGGQDKYDGTLLTFSAKEATVPLGCQQGLITSAQWEGGSGSVAFDQKPSRTALAVIAKYQSGKTSDQLVAVPLCYLLNSSKTRDGFRRAIQFDDYQRRKAYGTEVMKDIASKLNTFQEEVLRRVVQEINRVTQSRVSGISLNLKKDILAQKTASYIVSHTAVTDVIGCLVGLMHELRYEHADTLAEIIDHLLPLNYAPGVIQRLYEQLAADQLGLVENEVATRTLAEIIMAGYDQQPARFAVSPDGNSDMRGETALPYEEGPEVGPGMLPAVCNFLADLVARQDTLLGGVSRQRSRNATSAQSDTELQRMIAGYVRQLQGVLRGASKINRGRTVYCVLKLPVEGTPERDFCKQVIAEGRKRVIDKAPDLDRQLVFVELLQTPTDARESEVVFFIKARVMRTQPRKL